MKKYHKEQEDMKTYVLTLSQNFPAKHPRKGEPTDFNCQLLNGVWRSHNMSVGFREFGMNLHTIRANYPLWKKRFEQIEAGKAILSVRYWTGKPYASKQMEICKLSAKDGIGIQRLNFYRGNIPDALFYPSIEDEPSDVTVLAQNDGLKLDDWRAWFKSYDLSKPLAIIHFTKFRY